MKLPLKQLKHFSVETASGTVLGHVCDIVLDTEGQLVAQYIVKPSILSSKEYLISRDQIVRFENKPPHQCIGGGGKKMVVEDNSAQEKNKKTATNQVKASPEAVAMRKIS